MLEIKKKKKKSAYLHLIILECLRYISSEESF